MDNIWIQLIITVGGIFVGLFTLVRYFLKHLEKKDNSMERIADNFNSTISNHLHEDVQVKQKLVDSNKALTKAIDNLVYKK